MKLEPQYAEAYNAWKADKNPTTSYTLATALSPYVQHAIISAGGNPEDTVLRAKANMMAIALLDKYNPEKSTLQNFLYSNLRGLSRVVGANQNILPVSEYTVLGRKAIAEAEQELTDTLGRIPTTEEVANKIGIPAKTIRNWKKADVPVSEGLASNTMEGFDSSGGTSQIIGRTPADDAWYEYVYDSLAPRKQTIMERRYGMHGYPSSNQAQIASELGISSAAVNQHMKDIDKMINDESRYTLFED